MPSEPDECLPVRDVVVVRFPFTNLAASKQRPAVVVSNGNHNQSRPDLILMAITSQLTASLSVGDMTIVDWKPAGLLKPSAIKPVFATMQQTLVLQSLGRLELLDTTSLRTAIGAILQ